MRVLSREIVATHRPGRAPICGFVSYIHAREPVLLRRMGWEIADDVHDEFIDSVSRDNGRTWGQARTGLKNLAAAGGYTTFTENAAIYVPAADLLLSFTDQKFHPSLAEHDGGQSSAKLHITATHRPAAPAGAAGAAAPTARATASDFGLPQGVMVSFTHPLLDARGRVLVPVCNQREVDPAESRRRGLLTRADLPRFPLEALESRLLVGEITPAGAGGDGFPAVRWSLGGAVPFDLDRSLYSCEGTVAELAGGRLALVLRGSNRDWPDRPGYKWASFSEDGGATWSASAPLGCDDGSVIESSATGSLLFRSIRDGRLYWVGNLCLDGERPHGNMPRSPLVLAEVQEEPFALKRGTIAVIDRRAPHEDPRVQHSNFRAYQDRETGDLVLHLTRYGERGSDGLDWMKADQYRYRVAID